jgi:N-formylglutamate amidohydrolase
MRWSIAEMNIQRGEERSAAGLSDAVLADLYAAPYALCEPQARTVPFVFASPHSGRLYPETFLKLSRLSPRNLRCSEDAYVDQLIGDAIALGAPLLFARFPRAYVDANRAPGELDESMIEPPLNLPVEQSSPRVQGGLGVIPRIVRDGAEIYRVKLKTADVEERLSRLHRRYHAALATLIRETHAKFGAAVVVDCHSMPSAVGAPDIVLGDRYGTAASQVVLRHAEDALLAQGFSVGRNVPYAGGYTTHLYGEPARGVHALQIEINRRLYLDEERIELVPTFSQVQRRLMVALRNFTSIDIRALRPQRGMRFAAE